jgi:hypothetical protein
MVASVEKITIEEGTEPRTRIEHARYDGGERDGEDSLRYSTGFPLCDACMLLKSFEDIGEGTQGERGTAPTPFNQYFERCDRHEAH